MSAIQLFSDSADVTPAKLQDLVARIQRLEASLVLFQSGYTDFFPIMSASAGTCSLGVINTCAYRFVTPTLLHVVFSITGLTVSNAGVVLRMKLPTVGGRTYVTTRTQVNPINVNDAGAAGFGSVLTFAKGSDTSNLQFFTAGLAGFAIAAATTQIHGDIEFEVQPV